MERYRTVKSLVYTAGLVANRKLEIASRRCALLVCEGDGGESSSSASWNWLEWSTDAIFLNSKALRPTVEERPDMRCTYFFMVEKSSYRR